MTQLFKDYCFIEEKFPPDSAVWKRLIGTGSYPAVNTCSTNAQLLCQLAY